MTMRTFVMSQLVLWAVLTAGEARAQSTPETPQETETVDLFGFGLAADRAAEDQRPADCRLVARRHAGPAWV